MDIDQMIIFFRWMLTINLCIFFFSVVMSIVMKNFMVSVQKKLFDIETESLKLSLYDFLGLYKILIIVFNLVPYIALMLVP